MLFKFQQWQEETVRQGTASRSWQLQTWPAVPIPWSIHCILGSSTPCTLAADHKRRVRLQLNSSNKHVLLLPRQWCRLNQLYSESKPKAYDVVHYYDWNNMVLHSFSEGQKGSVVIAPPHIQKSSRFIKEKKKLQISFSLSK